MNIPQNDYQLNIAERVSSARKKLGITQEDLATAIGSTQSAIARMEAGNQNFTTQMLTRLSEVLGEDLLLNKSSEKTIKIIGNNPLRGVVNIQGAKNSALPAIAAALLASKGTTVIKNVPNLHDVKIMLEVASELGAVTSFDEKEHVISINAEKINKFKIPVEQSGKIRTCILFIAPLV